MIRGLTVLTYFATLVWSPGVARAQSAPTCAFDPAAAAVTVTVNGQDANVVAVVSSGEIRLNGFPCAAATVFNTDTIQVNGGVRNDVVSLRGTFAPGLTPESTGGSEIEISFALAGDRDEVVVNLGGGSDRVVFTSDGIDIGNDLDSDILTSGFEDIIRVYANGGNDHIDASAFSSLVTFIELHGGPGRDILTGSSVNLNLLFGDEDDDVLHGGDAKDQLDGGMGDDRMFGNGRNDLFYQGATADGADDMHGGNGIDEVRYIERTNGVTVTIGDTEPDGEAGEGDRVRGDVEKVCGGIGPDVLVGNSLANVFDGGDGDDELYGGGGDDVLFGHSGNDILLGDGGDDNLQGGSQDDFLDGGLGADFLEGFGGADTLHGGPGADALDGGDARDEFFGDEGNDTFVNDDGYAETVDCGPGAADDPQPSALDTFVGCEQI